MIEILISAALGFAAGAVGMYVFAQRQISKFTTKDASESPTLIAKDKTVYMVRAEADIYVGHGKHIRVGTILPSNDPAVAGRDHLFTKVQRQD